MDKKLDKTAKLTEVIQMAKPDGIFALIYRLTIIAVAAIITLTFI